MHDNTPTESDALRDIVSTAGADDPLALFEAETAPAEAPGAPPASAQVAPPAFAQVAPAAEARGAPPASAQRGEHPLSLDAVVNRLRFVSWAEAVAIVDALCVQLTQAGPAARVPELSQIALTSGGAVLVAGGAPTGPIGPRLARILHALTSQGAVPAPLRLFVSKWVAFEEGHSIVDFAKELAYFVRPEPEALIRAVYQRAIAATAAALPAPVPGETNRPKERLARARGGQGSRRMIVAVALVAVSLASALAWYGVSRRPDAVSVLNVSDLWSRGGQTASEMVSAVRQLAGLAPASTSPADPASSASTSDAINRSAGAAARRGSAGRTGARSTAVAATGEPSAVGEGPPGAPPKPIAALAPPSVAPNVPSPVPPAPAGVDEALGGSHIYSSADPDVTPPQFRYPQLPPPLLAGVQEDVNTIELIVTEAGTVERVRLLSPPRRMADMMLLSGAKTWRFEPALRGGESVRYRLLLSWEASP
jgi:hypothetical protein